METQDIYPELCGEIRKKYRTHRAFAKAIGMNPSTFSKKMAGKSQWSFFEVANVCCALGISLVDAPNFFRPSVARLQQTM